MVHYHNNINPPPMQRKNGLFELLLQCHVELKKAKYRFVLVNLVNGFPLFYSIRAAIENIIVCLIILY